jgi:Mg/Co/Ni transporter MgtE
MIRELTNIANELDRRGLTKEADLVDCCIKEAKRKGRRSRLSIGERMAKRKLEKWPAHRIAAIVSEIPAEKFEAILAGMTPESKQQVVGLLFENEEFQTLVINLVTQNPEVIGQIPPEKLVAMLVNMPPTSQAQIIDLLFDNAEFQSIVIHMVMQNANILGQLPPEQLAEIAKALPPASKEQVIKLLFNDPEFQAIAVKVVMENPDLLAGSASRPPGLPDILDSILNPGRS